MPTRRPCVRGGLWRRALAAMPSSCPLAPCTSGQIIQNIGERLRRSCRCPQRRRPQPTNIPHRLQRASHRAFIQSGFNEVRRSAHAQVAPRTSQKPLDSESWRVFDPRWRARRSPCQFQFGLILMRGNRRAAARRSKDGLRPGGFWRWPRFTKARALEAAKVGGDAPDRS